MRVLVIGGTRFVGPHVVRHLCEMGHEVTILHRGETEADLPPSVRHIHTDRRHLDAHADLFRDLAPRVVVDMIPITEEHAQGVVQAFRGIAGRVVAVSSQDVYRAYGKLIGIEPGPPDPVPISEDAPLRERLYPYRSASPGPDHRLYHYDKILVEQAVMGDPALPGTVLRLPMVYGERDSQHRLYEYLRRMDDGRPAIVVDDGLAHWQWTKGYVEDVAMAIVLAVTNERAAGQVYNVGEVETLTWLEWVRAIGRAAGWDGEVVVVPRDRLPEEMVPEHNTDQHLLADTARIREELGYAERVERDEALRRTVAWERAHPPEGFDPQSLHYGAEDEVLAALA